MEAHRPDQPGQRPDALPVDRGEGGRVHGGPSVAGDQPQLRAHQPRRPGGGPPLRLELVQGPRRPPAGAGGAPPGGLHPPCDDGAGLRLPPAAGGQGPHRGPQLQRRARPGGGQGEAAPLQLRPHPV